ncbi:MAG TPA: thiopeptide maturation pyridine synthase [Ktedonobacteraceae bacterium]|nr:thiopeptide maturation pyridine synthase [Ktedonobacteraceae bacterium]
MEQAEHSWHNASIYYYDNEKDHLLLDCVRPVFAMLAPAIEQTFFVRHWLRGPHVRLCFLTSDEVMYEVVKPCIEERVGAYLQQHPSQTILDEEKMRPIYQNLAQLEQEAGPILPLYPDNTIQYLTYDRRFHILKNDLLASIIEHFYVETNEFTFNMLDAIRRGEDRLLLSLDLFFTTAHKMIWPITRSFISYRSHAESFIARTPNPAAMRDLFEKKYALYASELTERLRQLLDALDHQRATFPFILEWGALIERYWHFALPLIEAKSLDLMPEDQQDHQAMRKHSPFHQRFYEASRYREYLYADAGFQAYRLALNLLYLHLNRLGIHPLQRAMLGHLAANTVEAAFAVSAIDLLGQSA